MAFHMCAPTAGSPGRLSCMFGFHTQNFLRKAAKLLEAVEPGGPPKGRGAAAAQGRSLLHGGALRGSVGGGGGGGGGGSGVGHGGRLIIARARLGRVFVRGNGGLKEMWPRCSTPMASGTVRST